MVIAIVLAYSIEQQKQVYNCKVNDVGVVCSESTNCYMLTGAY